VSLNIVSINPEFGKSNRPNQPVAALLEGNFTSNYKNRLPPEFLNQSLFDFKEKSEFTRMIVVADGDVAKNDVSPDGNKFRELGFDPVMGRKLYGNKAFLVNALNYLLGDAKLINVRSRSIKIRKLNQEKIISERSFWQVLNIALPVLLTVIFGLLQWFWRKKKYAY
jgi:ABC-2 type transport system permease protein